MNAIRFDRKELEPGANRYAALQAVAATRFVQIFGSIRLAISGLSGCVRH